MAWLDCERSGIYQLGFSFGGERFKRSLRTRCERTAQAAMLRVEENIRLVTSGRIEIPETADVATFLLSDGKLSSQKSIAHSSIAIGELFVRYRKSIPEDSLAPHTLRTAAIHMRHVVRLIGARRKLRTLKLEDLQNYVNSRATETGKRLAVSSHLWVSLSVAKWFDLRLPTGLFPTNDEDHVVAGVSCLVSRTY